MPSARRQQRKRVTFDLEPVTESSPTHSQVSTSSVRSDASDSSAKTDDTEVSQSKADATSSPGRCLQIRSCSFTEEQSRPPESIHHPFSAFSGPKKDSNRRWGYGSTLSDAELSDEAESHRSSNCDPNASDVFMNDCVTRNESVVARAIEASKRSTTTNGGSHDAAIRSEH